MTAQRQRYEVVVQPGAEIEIENAYQFIARDSPERAERWRERLLAKVVSLERWPRRCPVAPENDAFDEEIQHLLCGSYRLVFTVLEPKREVHVLHVRHVRRRALGHDADAE